MTTEKSTSNKLIKELKKADPETQLKYAIMLAKKGHWKTVKQVGGTDLVMQIGRLIDSGKSWDDRKKEDQEHRNMIIDYAVKAKKLGVLEQLIVKQKINKLKKRKTNV